MYKRQTLHPEGLAPRIVNLRQWRRHLLERMEQQLGLVRSAPLRLLLEEVRAYPEPPGVVEEAEEDHTELFPFALPLRIAHQGRVLSFLSTIATFNTPMDVTVSELALEAFLPADTETAAFLLAAVGAER